jgi:DNA primase small subunit
MDERTRAYLRGRFGDHYRRVEVPPPPAAGDREWGHIPFTEGSGTTMIRHQSWVDVAGGRSRGTSTTPPDGTTTRVRARWARRGGAART